MKPKIKIMKTGPQVTEQEINSFMDFDTLLKKKEALLHRRRRIGRMAKLTGLVVLAVIIALTLKNGRHTSPSTVGNESIVLPPMETSVDSLQAAMPPRESGMTESARQQAPPNEKNSRDGKPDAHSVAKAETKQTHPVYVQPEPVDGYSALYAYFENELRYPVAHAKDSIEGVVTVAFAIDVTGKATIVIIENSLGDAFDQEVRRLIRYMPLWRPATYNGDPVESRVSLPIAFTIQKSNPERQ